MRVTALRLDPDHYEFSLHSVAWDGPTALSIEKWAETLNLTAAVNAGMYLPDGKTNTGYMRRGKDLNNSRIASRYGGFFVCGPRREGLPAAAVLDRSVDDWETLLPDYDVAVQKLPPVRPGRSAGSGPRTAPSMPWPPWPRMRTAIFCSCTAAKPSASIALSTCSTPTPTCACAPPSMWRAAVRQP